MKVRVRLIAMGGTIPMHGSEVEGLAKARHLMLRARTKSHHHAALARLFATF